MKTESKTAYVAVERTGYSADKLIVSFDKPKSCEYWSRALVSEVVVTVPVLTQDDMDKLLAGEELNSLHAAKEKLEAETYARMKVITDRIAELQCIEFKEPQTISADMLAAVKQELEYQETTLEDIIFQFGKGNLTLTAEQLAVLTEAEARGNGQ